MELQVGLRIRVTELGLGLQNSGQGYRLRDATPNPSAPLEGGGGHRMENLKKKTFFQKVSGMCPEGPDG